MVKKWNAKDKKWMQSCMSKVRNENFAYLQLRQFFCEYSIYVVTGKCQLRPAMYKAKILIIIRGKQSREIYELYNKRQDMTQKRYKGHRYEAKSESLVDLLCL